MNERQSMSSHLRLQEILSIPERQRTDAQWDELNELEIALASVNRAGTHESGVRRNAPVSADQPKPSGSAQGKKPFKKFHKRPPKGSKP